MDTRLNHVISIAIEFVCPITLNHEEAKLNRESPASSQWLERAGRMMRGKVPPPIAELIGFTMVSMDAGQAVVEFEATERHANPMGTLHGGVLCDIADAAMGMACVSTLDEGETFTTLELKINFLKPV